MQPLASSFRSPFPTPPQPERLRSRSAEHPRASARTLLPVMPPHPVSMSFSSFGQPRATAKRPGSFFFVCSVFRVWFAKGENKEQGYASDGQMKGIPLTKKETRQGLACDGPTMVMPRRVQETQQRLVSGGPKGWAVQCEVCCRA